MAHYPGITARFSITKPDEAEATLTVTMKVKQWREIGAELKSDAYEVWPLRAAIRDLICEAEKTFYHRTPEE